MLVEDVDECVVTNHLVKWQSFLQNELCQSERSVRCNVRCLTSGVLRILRALENLVQSRATLAGVDGL